MAQQGLQLRWLVNRTSTGPERILQYRLREQVTDYTISSPDSGYPKTWIWGDWMDVPTVYGDLEA